MKNILSLIHTLFLLLCLLTPQSVSADDASPNEISIPFIISSTGHPIVTLKHGKKTLRMIIDTAAGANILSVKSAKKLKLKLKPSSGKAAGLGTAGHAMSNLDPITVLFNKDTFTLYNLMSLNLSHVQIAGGKKGVDGLLGYPFFKANNASVDYKTNLLTFTHPHATQKKLQKKGR